MPRTPTGGPEVHVIHRNSRFLGEELRAGILDLLRSPQLQWARSDALGRTARGTIAQLAGRESHERPDMVRIASTLATAVYEELAAKAAAVLPLPPSEDLVPQVFPVWMTGSNDDPPQQWPHRDRAGDVSPLLTALYYPLVSGAVGGALVLHDDNDQTVIERIMPATDLLIAIPGRQVHSVEALTAGERATLVTNFYSLSN